MDETDHHAQMIFERFQQFDHVEDHFFHDALGSQRSDQRYFLCKGGDSSCCRPEQLSSTSSGERSGRPQHPVGAVGHWSNGSLPLEDHPLPWRMG